MAYALMTCRRCGAQETRGAYGRGAYFCDPCSIAHRRESALAIAKVRAARIAGELPAPTECDCADCAKPATDYDHRDYTQPLEVAPVCRSCNVKRGPAFDSVYRPQAA